MIALVVSVLCLALNAFFVAAEFALVKVHVTKLAPRARQGDRRAKAALEVLSRLDRFLSVTQFGITVASLGLGWIGEPALAHLGDALATWTTGRPLGATGHVVVDVLGLGLLTFLHLLLGELVPKFVAIQFSEATVLRAARILLWVDRVFRPVLFVLERSQRAALRVLGIDPSKANEGTLSEEEIIGVLAANAANSPEGRDKQRIVERVLRFAGRPVRQMMVPRVDVFALPIDTPGREAVRRLRAQGFSRVLLTGATADDVVGYLYAKDVLLARDMDAILARPDLRGLERQAHYVPEMQDGLSVMRMLQRAQTPFAVVVDEYGGTSGIVTLEDLVEEIVGDIRDELDVENERVRRGREPETWDVDATATMDDLRDVGLPVGEEGAGEHVGKLVLERLGHLPRVGDVVTLADGVIAEIVTTSRRRIRRLRVTASEPAAP